MAAAAETGMDKAAMKQMLARSKKEPVNCAVALGKTQALLLLDKIKQPKALEKDLAKKFPDAKNPRWGTAFVDVEEAPKLVVFTLNKAAPGLAPKLKKALKGTGFSQIEIRLEDGSVAESAGEDDEDADEDGADAAPAGAMPAAPADAAPPPPAAPDAGALTRDLAALVKQMMAAIVADPTQKTALVEMATDAQASLKRGDLPQAAAGMDLLRQAIGAPAAAPPQDAQPQQAAPADAAGDGADQHAAGTDADASDADADEADADAGDGDAPDAYAAADAGDQDQGDQDQGDQDQGDQDLADQDQGDQDQGDQDQGASASADAPPAPPDMAALTATLTAVVKQLMPMVAADPSQRDALKQIVAQAQAGLKSGDGDAVSGHVDRLRDMLSGAAPAAPAAPVANGADGDAGANGAGPGAAPHFAKSRQIWMAARKKVDAEIGKLHAAFADVVKDHDQAADLGAAFGKRMGSVMERFDDGLTHKLDQITKNTDPAQHAKLVQEAHAMLHKYEGHLANDPLITALDENPIMPVAIHKTMTATLSMLGKALRA